MIILGTIWGNFKALTWDSLVCFLKRILSRKSLISISSCYSWKHLWTLNVNVFKILFFLQSSNNLFQFLTSSALLSEHCLLWSIICIPIFIFTTLRSPWASAFSLKFLFFIACLNLCFLLHIVLWLQLQLTVFLVFCLTSSVHFLSQTSLISIIPASVLPVVLPSLHLSLCLFPSWRPFSLIVLFFYMLYVPLLVLENLFNKLLSEHCVALHTISHDLLY